jgi:hypothetical protein
VFAGPYNESVMFMQVFFARVLLAEMNKELKGLRFLERSVWFINVII